MFVAILAGWPLLAFGIHAGRCAVVRHRGPDRVFIYLDDFLLLDAAHTHAVALQASTASTIAS
jgi:hypothetical protein